MKSPGIPTLEKCIGYHFKDRGLAEQALTHRSYRHEKSSKSDNERLEFLGDAALDLAAGHYLYKLFPDAREGDLTKLRSRLTSQPALIEVASHLRIERFLLLGKGEKAGAISDSIRSDALEAVLGAIFLDGGLRSLERVFKKLFIPLLERTLAPSHSDNPKGCLQEFFQQKGTGTPSYRVVSEEGPPHARVFVVEVIMNGEVLGQGRGPSKRIAQSMAAELALSRLG